jgi:hypothetical protein
MNHQRRLNTQRRLSLIRMMIKLSMKSQTQKTTGKILNQQPLYDKMVSAEILLPHGDDMQMGKVIGRTLGDHGKTMGSYDDNPVLNRMIYDVEFPDGNIKEYAANILAENMSSQMDPYGYNTILMKEVIDYRKDDSAVPLEDKYLTARSGQRRLRKTTQGWEVLVAWKDGTESWERLAT